MTMDGSHSEAARPRQQSTRLHGVAGLSKGPRCAAIIAANPATRIAGLEAAAIAMANGGVTSVRVNNPLNSPLTLQRILVQIDLDGGENDADVDAEALLACLLEQRRGTRDRIVLMVECAETLDPAALPVLQRIASTPGGVQILFVGGPAFWALLDDAELTPLRRTLTGQGTEPATIAPPTAAIPVITAPVAPVRAPASAAPDRPVDRGAELQPAVSARPGRRWWIIGAAGVAACITMGAAAIFAPGGLFYYAVPQRDMPTPPGRAAGLVQPPAPLRLAFPASPGTAPAPAPPSRQVATPALPTTAQADSLVPLLPPALSVTAHAETQQAHLQPKSAHPLDVPGYGADILTDAQRAAQWHTQSEQSPSWQPRDATLLSPPSPSEGRVVIHYRTGSEAGEAEAARLAAVVAPLAAKVQTRVVADTPSAPMIRFFHPEDTERARQLADVLGGAGPRWDVRNFSSFRPSPSLGTIEVWTPER